MASTRPGSVAYRTRPQESGGKKKKKITNTLPSLSTPARFITSAVTWPLLSANSPSTSYPSADLVPSQLTNMIKVVH